MPRYVMITAHEIDGKLHVAVVIALVQVERAEGPCRDRVLSCPVVKCREVSRNILPYTPSTVLAAYATTAQLRSHLDGRARS